MVRVACLVWCTVLVTAWSAAAATIGVPGAEHTIQEAIDRAAAGDTVLVAPGEYTESLTLKNGVTLKGEDRDTTIIHCLPTTGHVLTITDCATGTVEALTLEHLAEEFNPEVERERTEVLVITDSTVNIINCTIRNGNGNGISIKGTGKTTVRNSHLTENGANGITIFDGGARPAIENNEITRNTLSGIYYYKNCSGSAKDNRVTDNEQHGIIVDGPRATPFISGNLMRNNALIGLSIPNDGNPTTVNNDFRQNGRIAFGETRILFSGKRFDDLEFVAERLRAKEMRFKNGEWQLEGFYNHITTNTQSMSGTEEEAFLDVIDKWKERYPSSPTWRVALANAQINFGWHDRGTGTTDKVTDEGWQGFYEHLTLAWEVLQEARALDANDPEVYAQLATVTGTIGESLPKPRTSIAGLIWNSVTGNDTGSDPAASSFEEGAKKFPLYFPLYRTRAQMLAPKWGGGPGDLERLATESPDATKELYGDGIYAVIATSTLSRGHEKEYIQAYGYSEERIIQGIKDLIDRIEDNNWYKNMLAHHSCIARDKQSAREAFQEIGESFDVAVWPSRLRYVEYRDWATQNGDYPEKSQLGIAVIEGNLNRVAGLLDSGNNPNRTLEDAEPLINGAVREGHLKIAKLLLDAGADINVKGPQRRTPAILALEGNHNEMLRILLQNGADTEASSTRGRTPLVYAAYSSNGEAIRMLLEHEANPNVATSSGWTPLIYAANKSNPESVQLLLEHGADPNMATENQWTALHHAANKTSTESVRLLLKHGARPNAANSDGRTALMLVTERNDTDLALFLMKNGASARAAMADGDTALHNAAFLGNVTIARGLLERGADIEATVGETKDRPCIVLQSAGTLT